MLSSEVPIAKAPSEGFLGRYKTRGVLVHSAALPLPMHQRSGHGMARPLDPVDVLARARFNQLVLPRLDEGYRLARWLTRNATDAEDVVQGAILRAYRATGDFAADNARAWFLTIVRNSCYSWLERHRSHMPLSSEALNQSDKIVVESGGSDAEPGETPEDVLIEKDGVQHLARAVDALPVQLKEALVLREDHALSYRLIADVAGVPLGMAMSRLSRARRHLSMRFEAGLPR